MYISNNFYIDYAHDKEAGGFILAFRLVNDHQLHYFLKKEDAEELIRFMQGQLKERSCKTDPSFIIGMKGYGGGASCAEGNLLCKNT